MMGLIAAGAAAIAVGALLGFPYALVVDRQPWGLRVLEWLRIRHPRRLRQLHLDLIIMGGLLIAAGAALPQLPLLIALAIGIGGWSNPLLFAPLMFDEAQQQKLWYRAASVTSFVITSGGWVGVAVFALARWWGGA